jgi:transcriptional regulator with XRE-family HTH domain
MNESIGTRIARLRRARGFTQEELAEHLSVTAQAVSKWENDNSCPDISLLPALAKLLGVTTDTLLTGEAPPEAQLVPQENRKPLEQMMLRVRVLSHRGDKVKCNLPLTLVKAAMDAGLTEGGTISIGGTDMLKNIDWEQIFNLIDHGMIGKLVEVESAEGDTVEVYVE